MLRDLPVRRCSAGQSEPPSRYWPVAVRDCHGISAPWRAPNEAIAVRTAVAVRVGRAGDDAGEQAARSLAVRDTDLESRRRRILRRAIAGGKSAEADTDLSAPGPRRTRRGAAVDRRAEPVAPAAGLSDSCSSSSSVGFTGVEQVARCWRRVSPLAARGGGTVPRSSALPVC